MDVCTIGKVSCASSAAPVYEFGFGLGPWEMPKRLG